MNSSTRVAVGLRPTSRTRGYPFRRRPEDIALDTLIATIWAVYASLYLMKALGGGGQIFIAQFALLTVFAALFLLRRPARQTGARWESALAVAAALMPIALRSAPGAFPRLGRFVQLVGFAGMLLAVLSLGRSFGIAPADRGLRTTGLYRWVRHPLYATEMLVFVGFLLAHSSWWNLGILSLNTALQILRILREEPLLQGYADYTQRVRWRLLPLVW